MLLRWRDGSQIGVCLADTLRWMGGALGHLGAPFGRLTVVDKLLQGWLVARKVSTGAIQSSQPLHPSIHM